ncbi:hypothetical protein EBB79_21860 (plasmid) [Parasedimentitalea marina]|uniref:Uncharacterized protein n=1 Tax=Parasedimentitalea marina TaxID=2483033 RepID=A0A3T0N9B2_9RHOB|nr:hypothetical protein [Parasedimentitalea marina]AZV80616.1 hypothetical protein EBB79_21860 [Parasedimentitalea marina]
MPRVSQQRVIVSAAKNRIVAVTALDQVVIVDQCLEARLAADNRQAIGGYCRICNGHNERATDLSDVSVQSGFHLEVLDKSGR